MGQRAVPGDEAAPGPAGREGSIESSQQLLARARSGDDQALEMLCRRHLPNLKRWASGRMPRWARDILDTDDLVQETLLQTLRNMDHFEPRHDGALQAYLQQAVLNQIRDRIRAARRRPAVDGLLDSQDGDPGPSPLEEAIGREALSRYESALLDLRDEDREAIILRVELGCDYHELAAAIGKPSANAARMAVSRALVRLSEAMQEKSDG